MSEGERAYHDYQAGSGLSKAGLGTNNLRNLAAQAQADRGAKRNRLNFNPDLSYVAGEGFKSRLDLGWVNFFGGRLNVGGFLSKLGAGQSYG